MRNRTILAFTALCFFGACDNAEIGVDPADEVAPNHGEDNVGVADDGTQIIFAGPREGRRSRARTRPERDEENLIREPNAPDPEAGEFTLEEAVEGMPIDGTLVVEIVTGMGTFLCELYAERAPNTVANFVGLIRGNRPWWDARAGSWRREAYYRGLTFHRVVPGFLIQGGDYLGDGTGTVGYTINDELHDTLSHDRAGQLAMANHDGENSAGAQFFITDGPAAQLDEGGYTIFGQCQPTDLVSQIARVPQNPDEGHRPLSEVRIRRISVRRVQGGLAAALPTRPQLPEGEPETPRGAGRDPSAIRGGREEDIRRRYDPRQYGEPSPFPMGRTGPPSVPRPHNP